MAPHNDPDRAPASAAAFLETTFLETMPVNVAAQFWRRVEQTPDREAFRYPAADDQSWQSTTWQQAGEEVAEVAAGLLSLGIGDEQRVGIAAGTSYHWIIADLGVMCAGAATTTVYPSMRAEDVAFILSDAECRVVFVEDTEQLAKLAERRAELPDVGTVITFAEGVAEEWSDGEGPAGDWVITLNELRDRGRAYLADHPQLMPEIAARIPANQLATLIYTSGTTGRPKGVRLTHHTWVYEGEAVNALDLLAEDDLQFLWLPLAHCFGKVLLSAQLSCGFATAVDGRVDRIIDNLAVVRPTFMGAAPRIFEKAHARIVTTVAAEGGAKAVLFNRAMKVGAQVSERRRQGKRVPAGLQVQYGFFDKLIYSQIRQRFGGRLRFFVSGAAAMNAEIAEWFHACGITILEGYGLTESAAGSFVNRPDRNKIGTVGLPLPGTEVRIGKGNEVLVRGPGVMDGYHRLPTDTSRAFSKGGWLRTGDQGSLDDDGFLTITGRMKELFKTSGGKYVVPPAIEAKFKALCPYASQFLVFGDQRQYCVALITLDPDAMTSWAERNDLAELAYSELMASAQVHDLVTGYVADLNAQLNRWETIKKWRLLTEDLSIESGELTPSLKVKRSVVEERHGELIAAMYA
ncbi:MAG: AMP-dependent synthetase/ligase [Nocardioides sp.]